MSHCAIKEHTSERTGNPLSFIWCCSLYPGQNLKYLLKTTDINNNFIFINEYDQPAIKGYRLLWLNIVMQKKI